MCYLNSGDTEMVAFRFTEELSFAYSGSFKLVSGGKVTVASKSRC